MKTLFSALFVLAFSVLFAIALLDWLGGCGNSFVHADGTRHLGECIGRETFFLIFK